MASLSENITMGFKKLEIIANNGGFTPNLVAYTTGPYEYLEIHYASVSSIFSSIVNIKINYGSSTVELVSGNPSAIINAVLDSTKRIIVPPNCSILFTANGNPSNQGNLTIYGLRYVNTPLVSIV